MECDKKLESRLQKSSHFKKFPSIYNRASKDFKDRNKKANSWKKIAERLHETIDSVKRRYETIRTEFSRYLSKMRGRSGSGAGDLGVNPKYEHLLWLKPFIISRQSSGNFKLSDKNIEKSSMSDQPPVAVNVKSSEESHDATDSDEGSDDSIAGFRQLLTKLWTKAHLQQKLAPLKIAQPQLAPLKIAPKEKAGNSGKKQKP